MKWISVEGIREAEAVAFAQRNLPSYTAMCRAGACVARIAEKVAQLAETQRFIVVCGTGNNGGDGFVVARCLLQDGYDVQCFLTCVPARLKGDAARAWQDFVAVGGKGTVFSSPDAWQESPWFDAMVAPRRAIIIDALLGIGAKGRPHGAVAAAIHWINGTEAMSPVLSIDVPSGLNADEGTVDGEAVRADITITFSRPKQGFANPAARQWLGCLTVGDIGLPADILTAREIASPDDIELIAEPEMRTILRPERSLDSHKGRYGHALVIGGSACYPHAPILSARAAYRAGCGIVSLEVPADSKPAAAHWIPEAIYREPSHPYTDYDAILIGPGMGLTNPAAFEALQRIISDVSAPRAVVDADALTLLADLRKKGWAPDGSALRLILTPHPGEAARLLGTTVQVVQSDRAAAARAIAANYHAITVLKGHNTLVAEPGGRVHVCMGGNPGMATAGTGDLLAGVIVGLLARGLGTEDAACLGVYHHSLAGDAAAFVQGQESLIATDLFDTLRL